MDGRRKNSLLMLAIAVLWAVMPASLCLFASQPSGLPPCCHAAMSDCNAGHASMSGACCQAQPLNATAAQNAPITADHLQRLAFMPAGAAPQADVAIGAVSLGARAAPPPDSSSGLSTILRI